MLEWDHDRMAAFDVETSGLKPEFALQPWRLRQSKAWLTSYAFVARPDVQIGGLFPTKDQLVAMLRKCIDEKRRVVGWNIVFDVAWLIAMDLEELVKQVRWLDGMYLWMHATREPEYETTKGKRKPYKLKLAVAEIMPARAGYEEEVDFHSTDPAELAKLQAYNFRDTGFTLYCAWHWWQQLTPTQRRCAIIEAEAIPDIAAANVNGVDVDTLVTRELEAHLTDTANARLKVLKDHGVTEQVVRSPKKLAILLFDEWKLPVLKENTGKKTGVISRATDKEVLHELSFLDPRAKLLRQYRESLNNRTKFATRLLESADYNGDGRVHMQAIPYGTYTGRLTYDSKQNIKVPGAREGTVKDGEAPIGFALHQEKRGSMFRSVLVPPPGYDCVEFDAAGQEFRWMAEASGDTTMKTLCMPGEDPHCFMGGRISGVEYRVLMKQNDEPKGSPIQKAAEQHRYLGKIANFSLAYRTSANKLRVTARVDYDVQLELPEAQLIHATYRRSYPGVPLYWNRQIEITKKLGYVETFAGRRVQVTGDWTGNFGWSMASTSINHRIQGTGADQKYLALAVLKTLLTKYGARFGWDLHDGLYFFVPSAKTKDFIAEALPRLDNLPYREAWGFTPSIPMPWDCKVGGSWGSMKGYKLDA